MNKINITLVGAGGIASYLLPLLMRLPFVDKVLIIDGDKLEARNLKRQYFKEEHVRQYKATALAQMHDPTGRRIKSDPTFVTSAAHLVILAEGQSERNRLNVVIACVDNNPARRRCIEVIDLERTSVDYAIILGNETHSWDAMFVGRVWRDSPLHPYHYYPDLHADSGDDPTAPCTDEEAIAKTDGQLPLANALAAAHAVQLLQYWKEHLTPDQPEIESLVTDDNQTLLPFRFQGNGLYTNTHLIRNAYQV